MTTATQSLKLWEIASDLEAIGEIIADNGGEVTPFLEERLDEVEGEFDTKVERVALYIRETLANAEAAAMEEKRLNAIRKRFENKARGLKKYLHNQMVRVERKSVKTPMVNVSLRHNSRPEIRWQSEDPPPEEFMLTKRYTNLQKALDTWKAGEELPDGFKVTVRSHVMIS